VHIHEFGVVGGRGHTHLIDRAVRHEQVLDRGFDLRSSFASGDLGRESELEGQNDRVHFRLLFGSSGGATAASATATATAAATATATTATTTATVVTVVSHVVAGSVGGDRGGLSHLLFRVRSSHCKKADNRHNTTSHVSERSTSPTRTQPQSRISAPAANREQEGFARQQGRQTTSHLTPEVAKVRTGIGFSRPHPRTPSSFSSHSL
jgi:hypothetical protein